MAAEDFTFVASTTSTAAATDTAGTTISGFDYYRRGNVVLYVSAASGTWTLDVAIQTYVNGYWTDIARFAQMTATGTRHLWDIGGPTGNSSTIEEAAQSLDITVGTKRAGPIGKQMRAIYTITVTGSASLTWTVVGTFMS